MRFEEVDLSRPFKMSLLPYVQVETESPDEVEGISARRGELCGIPVLFVLGRFGLKYIYPLDRLSLYVFEQSITPPGCECGAEKCKTTHATWCPMWEEMD